MMRKEIWRCAAAGALAAALLAGCGQQAATVNTDNGKETATVQGERGKAPERLNQVQEPEAISEEDFDARMKVREDNPVSREFLDAASAFSYETAARLLGDGTENRNYSPLSLYYALALVAQGAEGETAQEMMSVLGVGDKAELAKQCANLYRLMYTDNEHSQLKLANSLWARNDLGLKEGFLKTAQNDFYASVYAADFAGQETGEAMGRWISEHTNGTLAPRISTSPQDLLTVINTVYFRDQWVYQFQEADNTQGKFTTADGEEVPCEYMHLKNASQTYYEGEGYSGTALWLRNNGCLMLILPDEGVDARDLIRQEGKLAQMFDRENGRNGLMNLSLPKFSFEDSMELGEMLQGLGMKAAFGGEADFSAMSDEAAFISRIKQETHIGINEDGVEASAYTQIAMAGGALPDGSYVLDFNRPFIFGIISDQGIPLFLGVCNNPQ